MVGHLGVKESLLDIFEEQSNGMIGMRMIGPVEDGPSQECMAEALRASMVVEGYGLLSMAAAGLSSLEALELQMLKDEGADYLVFNVAVALGLPGRDPKHELDELRELFAWVGAAQAGRHDLRLAVSADRYPGEARLWLSGGFAADGLKARFDEKIAASPVLCAWRDNILGGLAKTAPECDNLTDSLYASSLLSPQEKSAWLDAQMIPKHVARALRK